MAQFEHGLQIGDLKNNVDIYELFKCGQMGGMRRSKTTNTLILFSDTNNELYKNERLKNGIYRYTGMGQKGNQSIDYNQNKTLNLSNSSDITVYLFERQENQKIHEFLGEVRLASHHHTDNAKGADKELRTVVWFPLIEMKNSIEVNEFLMRFELSMLIEAEVLKEDHTLNEENVEALIGLMKANKVNSLYAIDGWFLSEHKYFYNPNTEVQMVEDIYNPDKDLKHVYTNQNASINPHYDGRRRPVVIREQRESQSEISGSIEVKTNERFEIKNLFVKNRVFREINVSFDDNRSKSDEFKTTVLIGTNGSGKSTVLSYIQKIMLDLSNRKNELYTSAMGDMKYALTYKVGDDEYKIHKDKGNTWADIKVSQKTQAGFLEVDQREKLPEVVIASSYILHDKFDFREDDRQYVRGYKYLGIRTSEDAAVLTETTRETGHNILYSITDLSFLRILRNICEYIKLDKKLKFIFSVNIDDFDFEKAKEAKYISDLKEIEAVELDENEMGDLVRFIQAKAEKPKVEIVNGKACINLDLEDESIIEEDDYFNALIVFMNKNIIRLESIQVQHKLGGYVNVEHLSSGENHFFTSMINIASKIQHGSLVLMDEPEISLHPNWQYKFIEGINNIFNAYKTNHFVIATHSHFMVSDLQPGNSSIVHLEKKPIGVVGTKLDTQTYGWSAEDILLNVFKMPTTRNHYIAEQVDFLLKKLSDGNNLDEIGHNVLSSLTQHVEYMKDVDPLKNLILMIKDKVDNEKS